MGEVNEAFRIPEAHGVFMSKNNIFDTGQEAWMLKIQFLSIGSLWMAVVRLQLMIE